MKIAEIAQKTSNHCSKSSAVINREEIWKDFIFPWYKEFQDKSQGGSNQYAYVAYMYGQGGIGKSFLCQDIAKHIEQETNKRKRYIVSYDLKTSKKIEENLFHLSKKVIEVTGNKDLFPLFRYAYFKYKSMLGKDVTWDGKTTKYDEIAGSSTAQIAFQVMGYVPVASTITGVMGIANDVYKLGYGKIEERQLKADFVHIDQMNEEELYQSLSLYFAKDLRRFIERGKDKDKEFVFILDTLENLQYGSVSGTKREQYLMWLVGKNGLIRLLPNTFWCIAGREEVTWAEYEDDSEKQQMSFISRKIGVPQSEEVEKYLKEQQIPTEIAKYILEQTKGYVLPVTICVDMYYKMWNAKIEEANFRNEEWDSDRIQQYRPTLEGMQKHIHSEKYDQVLEQRFMLYFSKQEKDIIYTLACLGSWTDEILKSIIWKNSIGSIVLYEELCRTSFIKTDVGVGRKTIQSLQIDALMRACPKILINNIMNSLIMELASRQVDEVYEMMFKSFWNCACYCRIEGKWQNQAKEALEKIVTYLVDKGEMEELDDLCQLLLKASKYQNKWIEEVLLIKYYCDIFKECTQEAEKVLEELVSCEKLESNVYKIWLSIGEVARRRNEYRGDYEILKLLKKLLKEEQNLILREYTLLIDAYAYRYNMEQKKIMKEDQLSIIRRDETGVYSKLESEICREIADIEESMKSCISEDECNLSYIANLKKQLIQEAKKLPEYNSDYIKWLIEIYVEILFECDADEERMTLVEECIQEYESYCDEQELEEDITYILMQAQYARMQGALSEIIKWAWKGIWNLKTFYAEDAINKPKLEQCLVYLSIGSSFVDMAEYVEEKDVELFHWLYKAVYKKLYIQQEFHAFEMLNELDDGINFCWNIDMTETIKEGIEYLKQQENRTIEECLVLLQCVKVLENHCWIIRKKDFSDEIYNELKKHCNNRVLLELKKKGEEAVRNNSEYEQLFASFVAKFFEGDNIFSSKIELNSKECFQMKKWLGTELDEEIFKVLERYDSSLSVAK